MKKKHLHILSLITLIFTPLLSLEKAYAGSDPTLGEISYFAGNFPPRGYAFCDGQLLSIAQNQSLFSLLGTTYGGDGRTTFALPDMRGRIALHYGNGPGLSNRPIGTKVGSERSTALPAHNHDMRVSSDSATTTTATNRSLATAQIFNSETPNQSLHASTIGSAGGSQQIDNVQPSITARCIIALVGTFPARN
mmetsp:Transcript_71679/g.226470  ORF Transcript_71679/g.226470 Transcript_71679/m.226470 type:complete len:193 (-) Transcript_71679:2581-3159(-)